MTNNSHLPKLTVAELMEVCDNASKRQRARLLLSLAEAGADPDTKLRELKEQDRYHGNLGDLFDYARTADGAAAIVQRSATRAGTTMEAMNLDPQQLVIEACRLCGWDLEEIGRRLEGRKSDPTPSPNP